MQPWQSTGGSQKRGYLTDSCSRLQGLREETIQPAWTAFCRWFCSFAERNMYMYIYMYMYVYVCMCIYVCVCECVCVYLYVYIYIMLAVET
jgi:hypothetical protein